jgi:hypothetical protein
MIAILLNLFRLNNFSYSVILALQNSVPINRCFYFLPMGTKEWELLSVYCQMVKNVQTGKTNNIL